jgi:hypothetical protein
MQKERRVVIKFLINYGCVLFFHALIKTSSSYQNAPQNADKDVPRIINDCVAMVGALLHLCDHPIQGAAARSFRLSMKSDFPDLNAMLPSRLIIPLQESLTAQIQPNVPIHSDYQAFPIDAPTFQGGSVVSNTYEHDTDVTYRME